MREIAGADLTSADVPTPDADWSALVAFRLTFNGYKRWGSAMECARIANAERHETLDDLRTCLFFEGRRWNHYGDETDEEAMVYIRAVVEKIRAMVESGPIP